MLARRLPRTRDRSFYSGCLVFAFCNARELGHPVREESASLVSAAKKVNIGIVGAGFIGQIAHLANYAAISDCRITALAELRPNLRRQVARRYDIERTYASHHEMLDDDRIDGIVVVTARPHIGPIALDCLRAGKHVFTEKPMTGNVEHASLLTQAAREQNVQYTVGYMKRYDDGVQRAKLILDSLTGSDELGRITFVRSHCFMGESYCNADDYIATDEPLPADLPRWPESPEFLGDTFRASYAWFLNVYSHNTNLLRYFLGGTPEVRHTHMASQLGGVVVLDYQGVPITLEVGRLNCREWDEVIEVYFENGRLQVKTPPALLRNVPAQVNLYRGDVHAFSAPQCEWRWSFRRQAEAFIRSVRDGGNSLTSGEDCLNDLRLAENIWRLEENQHRVLAAEELHDEFR
jgi:predicted dehydrogenase